MAALGENDFRDALGFVRECETAPDLPAYRKIVMRLREHVRGHLISYNEVDLANELVVSDLEPDDLRFDGDFELFGRYAHQHPVISHISVTGDLTPRAISDFISPAELHELDLYKQFYRRFEVEDQIAVGLPSTPEMVLGIAICRRERGFSERDRAFLELITPHVANAYLVARAQSTVREALGDRNGGSLDLVVLDAGVRIESMSGRAAELLGLYFDSPGERGGELPPDVAGYLARERGRIASPNGLGTQPLELTAQRVGAHLRGRLIPAREQVERDVLMLEEQEDPLSLERLHGVGLSRREIEVVRLLAKGRTNAEIARQLYLSPPTVKRHLERIYDKVGERSRTAVVARLLRG